MHLSCKAVLANAGEYLHLVRGAYYIVFCINTIVQDMEVKVLLEQFSFMMGGPLTSGCWRIEVAVRERKVYVGAVQAASLEELPEAIAEEALV